VLRVAHRLPEPPAVIPAAIDQLVKHNWIMMKDSREQLMGQNHWHWLRKPAKDRVVQGQKHVMQRWELWLGQPFLQVSPNMFSMGSLSAQWCQLGNCSHIQSASSHALQIFLKEVHTFLKHLRRNSAPKDLHHQENPITQTYAFPKDNWIPYRLQNLNYCSRLRKSKNPKHQILTICKEETKLSLKTNHSQLNPMPGGNPKDVGEVKD